MAAPSYVPNTLAEQPRRGLPLPPADRWTAVRPGEIGATQPSGPQLGNPGPDQGFALRLARQLEPRLVLAPNEHAEDAVAGCAGVALKRASLFGRAPIIHDLDIAFRVWGFLGEAPDELLRLRTPLFQSVSHHYDERRAIVDQVPTSTLRLSHGEVASRFPGDWKALLGLT